jgi:hypothetical protein
MCNSKRHPEAWAFFIEHARNIQGEPDINHLGKYRIPVPDRSGNFIYADDTGILWSKFIEKWYEANLDSPSVYGIIQYVVTHF